MATSEELEALWERLEEIEFFEGYTAEAAARAKTWLLKQEVVHERWPGLTLMNPLLDGEAIYSDDDYPQLLSELAGGTHGMFQPSEVVGGFRPGKQRSDGRFTLGFRLGGRDYAGEFANSDWIDGAFFELVDRARSEAGADWDWISVGADLGQCMGLIVATEAAYRRGVAAGLLPLSGDDCEVVYEATGAFPNEDDDHAEWLRRLEGGELKRVVDHDLEDEAEGLPESAEEFLDLLDEEDWFAPFPESYAEQARAWVAQCYEEERLPALGLAIHRAEHAPDPDELPGWFEEVILESCAASHGLLELVEVDVAVEGSALRMRAQVEQAEGEGLATVEAFSWLTDVPSWTFEEDPLLALEAFLTAALEVAGRDSAGLGVFTGPDEAVYVFPRNLRAELPLGLIPDELLHLEVDEEELDEAGALEERGERYADYDEDDY